MFEPVGVAAQTNLTHAEAAHYFDRLAPAAKNYNHQKLWAAFEKERFEKAAVEEIVDELHHELSAARDLISSLEIERNEAQKPCPRCNQHPNLPSCL
jgi:hypothetical protein